MDSRTPVRLKGEGELCPRVAEAELREQMCRLWQEAFGDERDFVMHYLSRFSHSGNRLLRFDESGRLVAMMHMHPFTIGMKGVPGDEVAVRFEPEQGGLKGSRGAYVYGVATAKECRGRGIASEMLADAMRAMGSRGADFVMLIAEEPSLRRWYGGMGFVLLEGVTASVAAADGTNLAMDDASLNVPMICELAIRK